MGENPPSNVAPAEVLPENKSKSCKVMSVDECGCSSPQHCCVYLPHTKTPIAKKAMAEFVGTFILIFCAAGGAIVNQKYDGIQTLVGTAASAGVAVMIVIFCIGHMSGAHLNPAVTISLASIGHFPWIEVPGYIFAQVTASIFASFVLKGIFHPFMSGGVTVPLVTLPQSFFLEFFTTFNLMFVIASFSIDKHVTSEMAGIGVGAVVFLDILIAGPSTGASMNPVRYLGPAVATGNYQHIWLYLLAPMAGGLAGTVAKVLITTR